MPRSTWRTSSRSSPRASNAAWDEMMPDSRTAMSVSGAMSTVTSDTERAPSVTVYTNIAGAVAVTADRAIIDAGRRLRSIALPENPFNLNCANGRKRDDGKTACASIGGNRGKEPVPDVLVAKDLISAAAAAAVAVEGIKSGVREALGRWALQTSRRESTMLWKHECSRYASTSRIGYHPNHPSSSRPGSRPSSAVTLVRPFSATSHREPPCPRASSAVPPRSLPLTAIDGDERQPRRDYENDSQLSVQDKVNNFVGRASRARPRSAIPRLGIDVVVGDNDTQADELICQPSPRQTVSASDPRRLSRERVRRGGARSARSHGAHVHGDDLTSGDEQNGGDDDFGDIYEDLDEDDGELDNRISILENRFSTVGRERPASAVKLDGYDDTDESGIKNPLDRDAAITPATGDPLREEVAHAVTVGQRRHSSARRPPRAPRQQTASFGGSIPRRLVSADPGGLSNREVCTPSASVLDASVSNVANLQGAPRIVRKHIRPTSAPADGSNVFHRRRVPNDPLASLHARRLRLQHISVRNVTTAVPAWDPDGDGGGDRPLSSATADIAVAASAGEERDLNNLKVVPAGSDAAVAYEANHYCSPGSASSTSRPSSAAFRRWADARPSAKSAISTVSSARTLGMDDPELIHLQLEMESRRGVMSETAVARMDEHYNAVAQRTIGSRGVLLKNRSTKRARPTTLGKGSNNAVASSGGSRKGTSREKSPRNPKTRSESLSESRRTAGKRKGGKGTRGRGRTSSRRGKSPRLRRGRKRNGRTGSMNTGTPRKLYTSALAFMAEHFPRQEMQEVSLLGMEQELECRHVSDALSRAGIAISGAALRRALIIPTDRPIEACLAGLPLPSEGLRDTPFRIPSSGILTKGRRLTELSPTSTMPSVAAQAVTRLARGVAGTGEVQEGGDGGGMNGGDLDSRGATVGKPTESRNVPRLLLPASKGGMDKIGKRVPASVEAAIPATPARVG